MTCGPSIRPCCHTHSCYRHIGHCACIDEPACQRLLPLYQTQSLPDLPSSLDRGDSQILEGRDEQSSSPATSQYQERLFTIMGAPVHHLRYHRETFENGRRAVGCRRDVVFPFSCCERSHLLARRHTRRTPVLRFACRCAVCPVGGGPGVIRHGSAVTTVRSNGCSSRFDACSWVAVAAAPGSRGRRQQHGRAAEWMTTMAR